MVSGISSSLKPSKGLKRRSILLGCAVIIPLAVVLIFVSTSLFNQSTQGSEFVSFTCNSTLRNRTFTIPIKVNLTDGMNREEATAVATAAFKEAVDMGEGSTLKEFSTTADFANGTWKVRISSIFLSSPYGAWRNAYEGGSYGSGGMTVMVDLFLVIIDPNTRIIDFIETSVPID